MEVKAKYHIKSILVMIIMMFIINNSISANDPQKDTSRDSLSSSVGIWHPDLFYSPNFNVMFMLPYEPDRSGCYNMFFISKESGETLLFDTIINNQCYAPQFSYGSHYEVVLLYNNGKYVKENDVVIENGTFVNMRNNTIQPSDSISKNLKTIRSFDYAIIIKTSESDDGEQIFRFFGTTYEKGGEVEAVVFGRAQQESRESYLQRQKQKQ